MRITNTYIQSCHHYHKNKITYDDQKNKKIKKIKNGKKFTLTTHYHF